MKNAGKHGWLNVIEIVRIGIRVCLDLIIGPVEIAAKIIKTDVLNAKLIAKIAMTLGFGVIR